MIICIFPHQVYATNSLSYPENQCLSFDGTDDYVSCGSPDTYVYRAEKVTVEFWMKPEYTIESGSDVLYGRTTGAVLGFTETWCWSGGWALYFDFSSGCLCFRYKRQGVSPYTISTNRKIWTAGSWYHIAVTYDASPSINSLIFYVNGTIDKIQSGIHTIYYENSNLKIGRYPANEYMFGGLIDEVRFWNVYKTQTAIQSAWNRILNETECAKTELIGYWRFDEGSGNVSEDYSGQDNNALLALSPYSPTWVDFGAPIIPEFPSAMLMPLFMVISTVALVFTRKKKT